MRCSLGPLVGVVPALITAVLAFPAVAHAADPVTAPDSGSQTDHRDVRNEIPIVAYSYTAYGASKGTVGVQAYGLGITGNHAGTVGGGGTVWAAPIERLTIIADGQRDFFGNFAPSAAAMVRLLGEPGRGWSLGALGKFKVDGFGLGPNNEMESEIESGLLLSYVRWRWHLDLNAIAGFGTGDDGEVDSEGRLRVAYDLTDLLRVGVDEQARYRLAGIFPLPGGRTWDFAGGPQVLLGSSRFFGAVTAGPTTMGVFDKSIGWSAIVSVGGLAL